MDYVLFGMGYGASLMLLGWALRTFGPQRKYARPPHDDGVNFQVEQRFWVRFIQGLGGAIAIAGTTMVLMTFVVVLVNPDDDTGALIALAIWAFILIAMLLWCWMYVRHYGLTGIWSRSGGYGFRRSSAPQVRHRSGERPVVASVTPRKRLNRDEDVVPDTPEPVDVDPVLLESAPSDQPDIPSVDETESVTEETTPEPADTGDTAVYDFGDVDDTTVPSDAGGRSEALRRLRERQARARQSSD